jgi:hypothetical protein
LYQCVSEKSIYINFSSKKVDISETLDYDTGVARKATYKIEERKGVERVTDTELLKSWIEKSGYKRKYIADMLDLTTYSLQMKVENKVEFKPSEINKLCALLKITSLRDKERIFFSQKVAEKETS